MGQPFLYFSRAFLRRILLLTLASEENKKRGVPVITGTPRSSCFA
jgi:hypothetical protein